MRKEKNWYLTPLGRVFSELDSQAEGLTNIEAQKRLKDHGLNILPHEKPYSKLSLFLSQFKSPLVIIFILAGGISLYLGHYSDAIFIIIVLLINTSVGFYQENKANSSLNALRSMVKIRARVLREGNLKEIDSEELVPGDIIQLKAGSKVPADARLVEVKNLKINELSALAVRNPEQL